MLMAMDLFQGIKDASMNRWKVCAGYFMQPAVECCVSADKFLDNSIRKQNPCAVSVAASFIPFLSLKQNLKNRKGMVSCRVFPAWN